MSEELYALSQANRKLMFDARLRARYLIGMAENALEANGIHDIKTDILMFNSGYFWDDENSDAWLSMEIFDDVFRLKFGRGFLHMESDDLLGATLDESIVEMARFLREFLWFVNRNRTKEYA